jgi:hypothetical protein
MSAFRLQGSINSAQGPALNGVLIYVCTQPASTGSIPPSPLASIFTDATGGTPLANPITSDGLGNWFFYAAAGTYTLVLFDPLARMPTTIFPDQQVVTSGGGSVTSVALTMPAEFSVAGSPLTTTGTLAVTKANQNANIVYAGPTSGGAAAPAFRALVAADLPAGQGTVTSITLVMNPNALFTLTVSGTNPLTTSGTMTINLGFATQAANTVLAGPASGGNGAISARVLVAADISGITPVSGATPTCDCSTFAMPTFTQTLAANTAPSVTNGKPGQVVTFVITSPGGFTFTWPATFRGATNVDTTQSGVTVQSFVCISSSLFRAVSDGSFSTLP